MHLTIRTLLFKKGIRGFPRRHKWRNAFRLIQEYCTNRQFNLIAVGEREIDFLIKKINKDSVEGLWLRSMPIETPNDPGTPKTLYIGDDIGYVCAGVSEKLTTINFSGQTVTFTKVVGQPSFGGCPICLAAHTLIDTPAGAVAVENVEKGMEIWTRNHDGERVSAVVIATVKTPVPPTHRVVPLVLDDEREFFVSPRHPTGDGRTVGDLSVDDSLSGGK